jgi:hypothetical protein
MKNATLIWVVLAVLVTWYLAKAHSRVRQSRASKGGKLLSFTGGRAAAGAADQPIPQSEDLPTAI